MGEGETDRSVQVHTGRPVPILGLGTSPMRGREAYDAVHFALEAGYRLIDTATSYHNQEEVGRAIRDSGLARAPFARTDVRQLLIPDRSIRDPLARRPGPLQEASDFRGRRPGIRTIASAARPPLQQAKRSTAEWA